MAAGGTPPRRGWYYDKANSRLQARYNNTTFLQSTATATTIPLATTFTLGATFSSTVATGNLTVTGTLTTSGINTLGGTAVTGTGNTVKYPAAGTVVTAVGIGVHVPAISYTDAGATGTIAELNTVRIAASTVLATNTITYTDVAGLKVSDPVASTGATFTRKYGVWTTGAIRTATNVFFGDQTATFASTQPVGAIVFATTTAPVGAVTSSGAIYTDGTVIKKIIANGTASNIET